MPNDDFANVVCSSAISTFHLPSPLLLLFRRFFLRSLALRKSLRRPVFWLLYLWAPSILNSSSSAFVAPTMFHIHLFSLNCIYTHQHVFSPLWCTLNRCTNEWFSSPSFFFLTCLTSFVANYSYKSLSYYATYTHMHVQLIICMYFACTLPLYSDHRNNFCHLNHIHLFSLIHACTCTKHPLSHVLYIVVPVALFSSYPLPYRSLLLPRPWLIFVSCYRLPLPHVHPHPRGTHAFCSYRAGRQAGITLRWPGRETIRHYSHTRTEERTGRPVLTAQDTEHPSVMQTSDDIKAKQYYIW